MRLPKLAPRADRAGRPLRSALAHTGGVMALVTLLVASGAGVTYALWNASATTGSTAKAGLLAVTATFLPSGGTTIENHDLTVNGEIVVTNTTARNGNLPVTTQITADISGAPASMASQFNVRVWSVTGSCNFSSPAGAVTNWGNIAALTTDLARNASIRYCVTATAKERGLLGVAGGSFTISPKATSTVTFAGSTWSTSATASVTQTTQNIYPTMQPDMTRWVQLQNAGTTKCVDVWGWPGATGYEVIDYGCKSLLYSDTSGFNQHWQFAATTSGYYTIAPRHATTRRMGVVGNSTAVNAAITVQTADANNLSQQWQLQDHADGTFQLVNRASGLCLVPRDTSVRSEVEYAQATCDDSTVQSYRIPPVGNVSNFSCTPTNSGNNNNNRYVTLSWTTSGNAAYEIERRSGTSGSWSDVTTVSPTPAGTASYVLTNSNFGNWDSSNVLQLRVIAEGGGITQVTITRTSNGYSCS